MTDKPLPLELESLKADLTPGEKATLKAFFALDPYVQLNEKTYATLTTIFRSNLPDKRQAVATVLHQHRMEFIILEMSHCIKTAVKHDIPIVTSFAAYLEEATKFAADHAHEVISILLKIEKDK